MEDHPNWAGEVAKFAPKRSENIVRGTQSPFTQPIMPKAAKLPTDDEADEEIRRTISRRHAMLAEISELTSDRDHFKNRTELAEAVVGQLKIELADAQALIGELKDTISRLRTHLEHGVDSWVKGLDLLNAQPHAPKNITPKLESKTDEPANRPDLAS